MGAYNTKKIKLLQVFQVAVCTDDPTCCPATNVLSNCISWDNYTTTQDGGVTDWICGKFGGLLEKVPCPSPGYPDDYILRRCQACLDAEKAAQEYSKRDGK